MNAPAKQIFLARPDIRGSEQAYAADAIASGWVTTLGPYVERLERELATYVGVDAACATASGTSAIHLALKLAGVSRGDMVFCSSLTFAASANPILYEKATPVFIDSEPQSFNMSLAALEKAFQVHKPKAVIIVDLYGQAADMDPIISLCRKHGAVIIEDAAEALGATYKDKQCGSFGDFGILSFNGNKIVTGSTGGLLLSNNMAAIDKARFWATQAREPARHYQHNEIGYNYRLSNVAAAIACAQFEKLSERITAKKHIYDRYATAFAHMRDIEMLPVAHHRTSNYWLSCARLPSNNPSQLKKLFKAFDAAHIEARPIWKPMHMQPVFADYPYFAHDEATSSVSQTIFETGICLPSDTNMTDADQDKAIAVIKHCIEHQK